ncbi:MAG: M23 family metallopeptidase [Thalassovita sp.]
MRLSFAALTTLAFAPFGAAADPVLVQPIECELGATCYIQHYVDRDPTPSVQDFGCGALSYDGHKGTDFALISLQQMRDGVNVVAAAPGVVRGVRDEMPDTGYTEITKDLVQGKECGNGVAIDHGGGWVSQYCHMKRDSIIVEPGRRVAANAVLGQVGLSGRTQFPHLHISIRKDGQIVDPFPSADRCFSKMPDHDLWQDDLLHTPGGVIDLGFATSIPSFDAIKQGQAHATSLTTVSPAVVTWVYAYGSQAGDVLALSIAGPEGLVVKKAIDLEKSQAQLFRAIGRKRPDTNWPTGTYTTRAVLLRGDQVLSDRSHTIDLR